MRALELIAAPRRAHTRTQEAWELCSERRRSGTLPRPAAARRQTLDGAGALTRGRGIMVREVLDSGEEAHTWFFPQRLQPRSPLQEVPRLPHPELGLHLHLKTQLQPHLPTDPGSPR